MILIPYPNLALSAHAYSDKDLFYYQYYTRMLLQIMSGTRLTHPGYIDDVYAWERYPVALFAFHNSLIVEWDRRDYKPIFNKIITKFDARRAHVANRFVKRSWVVPGWLGWEQMHRSHRKMLALRSHHYRGLWSERGIQMRIVRPLRIPSPGHFLVKGALTGLILEHLEDWILILSQDQKLKLRYSDVERGKWLPDTLPVHERLQLEYGPRTNLFASLEQSSPSRSAK